MKKKFLVIGNPIDHSLSPKLHNYWIKKYKIDAVYEKKLLHTNAIEDLIFNIREEKIHGLNVTVPFKKTVIPFLDILSDVAKRSESVNTIYKKKSPIPETNTFSTVANSRTDTNLIRLFDLSRFIILQDVA